MIRQDAGKILKAISIFLFFVLIITYAFFRSYDLIFGIKIKNINILDNPKTIDNTIKITGNAKNAIELKLNGREIFIDKMGTFNETLVLLPGYNIITLEAKDKFGHSDRKNYKLIN